MLIVAFGECTMSRTQVQLWYNRFKEGREDVNDDAGSGRPSTSTIEENCIEAMKKMILGNQIESLLEISLWMMWAYRQLMPSNFYGCFRHEMCGSKDCSKIAKF